MSVTAMEVSPAEPIGSLQSGPTFNEKRSLANDVHAVNKDDFLLQGFQPDELRQIVREAILIAGGAVAILLQIAHPGVGAGVREHSNFSHRPTNRLRTTMTYIYCMAFGTPEEKKQVIEFVNGAHAPVNGVMKEGKGTGKPYNAVDPELQLWVASTLYACGITIYEKVFGKLCLERADQIYREYSVLAVALQVPPEMWPQDRPAFWKYWDDNINTLDITPAAKEVARDLLWSKKLPFYLSAQLPAVRLLTAEWLPPRMRKEYGLKTSRRRRVLYNVYMSTLKGIYPHMPLFIRTYPLRYYMKDMRKRMKNVDTVIGKEV